MSNLTLDGVAGVRGDRTLFADVGIALRSGDAALVTGPNGAGKSTLLRIAGGLLAPAAGTISCSGKRAWLGEAAALDPARPLGKALDFWAGLDGTGGSAAALDAVGLTRLAEVPVRFLSTGQRRRAALARVIAGGAEIWLLDEPANGLDAQAVETLAEIVARHRANGGIAVIATHLPIALPGAVAVRLGEAA